MKRGKVSAGIAYGLEYGLVSALLASDSKA